MTSNGAGSGITGHRDRETMARHYWVFDLDVTASRTGDRLFLHVVNIRRTASVRTRLAVDGYEIQSGRAYEIAIDPTFEIMETCATVLDPVERAVSASGEWTFPPASVTALEMDITAVRSSDAGR